MRRKYNDPFLILSPLTHIYIYILRYKLCIYAIVFLNNDQIQPIDSIMWSDFLHFFDYLICQPILDGDF